MAVTIFVVDDEPAIRAALVKRLTRRHHHVVGFDSGEALLASLEHDIPDLILLDVKMPGLSGLDTLKNLQPKCPQALVIMLTAYGTVQDAVEAMKAGAYDFIIKSVDFDGLDQAIARGIELLTLRQRVLYDTDQGGQPYAIDQIVARSPAMQHLVGQVREVAANGKTTVLLLGETGTGKEFMARVLHYNGPRREGPFVGVNCTAIPRELFESELFGYERGAFTGAVQRKLGLLDRAEGGTLFLDEIGDLDPAMQAKLLRVIQERTFRRLGGNDDIAADFRLMAATHRDLKHEVARGAFREDLFFRLNVVMLELPPLRHRVEDILPLAEQAVTRYAQECGKEVMEIDPEARRVLDMYAYPGNIRELHNIIERAMIFCHGRQLTAACLPPDVRTSAAQQVVVASQGTRPTIRIDMALGEQTLAEIEQAIIHEVIRVSEFNKTQAAKYLGLTRFALERRLKKSRDASPSASPPID